MKAKEYAEKYIPIVRGIKSDEDAGAVSRDLYMEYALEVEAICKMRNIKLDRGFKSVIAEQNQKWNAMIRHFEASGLSNVFKPNGFLMSVEAMLKR